VFPICVRGLHGLDLLNKIHGERQQRDAIHVHGWLWNGFEGCVWIRVQRMQIRCGLQRAYGIAIGGDDLICQKYILCWYGWCMYESVQSVRVGIRSPAIRRRFGLWKYSVWTWLVFSEVSGNQAELQFQSWLKFVKKWIRAVNLWRSYGIWFGKRKLGEVSG
jgi:hypothetical protein